MVVLDSMCLLRSNNNFSISKILLTSYLLCLGHCFSHRLETFHVHNSTQLLGGTFKNPCIAVLTMWTGLHPKFYELKVGRCVHSAFFWLLTYYHVSDISTPLNKRTHGMILAEFFRTCLKYPYPLQANFKKIKKSYPPVINVPPTGH